MSSKIDFEKLYQRLEPTFGPGQAAVLAETIKDAVEQAVSPTTEKPAKRKKSVEELQFELKRHHVYMWLCLLPIGYSLGLLGYYSLSKEPMLGVDAVYSMMAVLQIFMGTMVMLYLNARRKVVKVALHSAAGKQSDDSSHKLLSV